MDWFMCSLFYIPAMFKKKSPVTHKLCPNDNRGSTITGNTFTTNRALSAPWLVLRANQHEMTAAMFFDDEASESS